MWFLPCHFGRGQRVRELPYREHLDQRRQPPVVHDPLPGLWYTKRINDREIQASPARQSDILNHWPLLSGL